MSPPDPPATEPTAESHLDDPALIAEIEAEFAELTAELERIHALPRSMAPKKAELIKSLREQWSVKQAARADRPEWRKKMDDALGEAISRVLEDGIHETGDGRLEFGLRGDSIQTHGQPLIGALLEGFQHMLLERFAKPPPTPAPGKKAAPPNPLQGLVVGLGQMLAQAIENTRAQAAARAAARTASAKVESTADEEGNVKIEVRPADAAADETPIETEVAQVEASVGFDTRKGDALPPILPEMFQSLVAGLGKMLNDASQVRPKAKPAAAPPPSDPVGEVGGEREAGAAPAGDADEAPAGEAAATEAPAAPAETVEPAPQTEPHAPSPAAAEGASPKPSLKIDFAGLLGQLFKVATPVPGAPRPAADPKASAPPEGDAEPEQKS